MKLTTFSSLLIPRSLVDLTRPQSVTVKVREKARAPMGVALTRSSVAILRTLTRTTGAPPPVSPAPETMRATQTPLPSSSSCCRANTLLSSSVNLAPQQPPRDLLHHLRPQHLHCPRRFPPQWPPPLYLPSLCPRRLRCPSSSQERPFTLKGFHLLIHL